MTTAAPVVIDWSRCAVLESKPETQGGAWVFRGTRVPVTELAEEFPTVRKEEIAAVLDFLARSAEAQ